MALVEAGVALVKQVEVEVAPRLVKEVVARGSTLLIHRHLRMLAN